jgi:hypothetical protein
VRRRTRWALLLGLALTAALAASIAWARVGGGHSYSGGGSRGGFSGGGGGNSRASARAVEGIIRLVFALIRLAIERPWIGIPVNILVIYVAYRLFRAYNNEGYEIRPDNLGAFLDSPFRRHNPALVNSRLEQLRTELDPNFSRIAIKDFLHALYATVHRARGPAGGLARLSGYLSNEAIRTYETGHLGVRSVGSVVIGASSISNVSPIPQPKAPADELRKGAMANAATSAIAAPTAPDPWTGPHASADPDVVRITVEFEACYTEENVSGAQQSWYARETWVLARKASVLSREPARMRQISCPACGAPASAGEGGRCPSCGNTIRSGLFDWYVETIVAVREQRPPLLSSTVVEVGNDLPTLLDPGFGAQKKLLESQDLSFSWTTFNSRAAMIFMELQTAWTERRWEVARPFESDALFETHAYWIREYRQQKRINVLERIRLEQMVPVKIAQDRYFTAITLRVYASMIDTTRTEDGKILSGDPKRARKFTEYWTFMRGRTAKPPKPGAGPLHCPACGAPLKISMAGLCEYCKVKVTAGDFDWVLSSIEQDEAYAG